MKNITKLILKNFQQWKDGNIEFTKGLNVLMGDTECGKSTIFRAISSILTGKMPEDYIRKGAKGCDVELYFDDNSVFKRSRSKKDNIAIANENKYERVGKDIPFDYFKALGNTSITFGDKNLSLCLYSQFEPHFFITLSDYDKSKLIGTICGIDIVDKLVDSINKDIRQSNSNIKFLKEQLESDNEVLQNKKIELNKQKDLVDNLEGIKNKLLGDIKTLENLSNLDSKSISIKNNINIYEQQLKLNLEYSRVFNQKDNIELLKKLYDLQDQLSKIEFLFNSINNRKKQVELISNYSFDNNKVEVINKLQELSNKLYQYKCDIINSQNNLHALECDLESLIKEKNNLLRDFDKCPLCGGLINEK